MKLRLLTSFSAIAALVLLAPLSVFASPVEQTSAPPDFALADGWFYTQASDQADRGFAVTDNEEARFWSEFRRLGGVQGVGYPISQRFVWDGFVSQAFQKMVFQWRPEIDQVYAVNVLDVMHERGFDDWLRDFRATPPLADWSSDAGRSWSEIVTAHQALLTDPDIRATYYAVPHPVMLYGLPMAPIQDMGNVLVLRAQRGILQKWLINTPWAEAGQVTVANSGDLAKEAGLLPEGALQPILPPEPPPAEPSSLNVVLSAEPRETTAQAVTLTLQVTNTSSDAVEWQTNLPVADFEVLRDGRRVWLWSSDRAFAAVIQTVRLEPGETQTFQEDWPLVNDDGQPVPPGEYQAVGILTSSPAAEDPGNPVPLRSDPVTLTVR